MEANKSTILMAPDPLWKWVETTNRRKREAIGGKRRCTLPAFFAAYRLASSCALPIFFLYRIRLFPNQLETCKWLTHGLGIERQKGRDLAHLWHGYGTFSCQLLFGLFAGIRIREMWIEIFVENFGRLFWKVAPFSSVKKRERGRFRNQALLMLVRSVYNDYRVWWVDLQIINHREGSPFKVHGLGIFRPGSPGQYQPINWMIINHTKRHRINTDFPPPPSWPIKRDNRAKWGKPDYLSNKRAVVVGDKIECIGGREREEMRG